MTKNFYISTKQIEVYTLPCVLIVLMFTQSLGTYLKIGKYFVFFIKLL